MSALIFGCGYLGLRVAKAWVSAGRKVFALTRGRADLLRSHGIEPIVGDVLDPATLTRLPETRTVLYAVGLDRSAGRPMREVYVEGLRNVITALANPDRKGGGTLQTTPSLAVRVRRIIYISSTSVYGQTDASWIDETSPTEPLEESGKVVLEAEQTLRTLRPDAIMLRFSGIYGPDRVLRKASLLKGEPVPGDAERFLNLIHVDDGVRAVLSADERAEPGETYLIADDHPATRREFFTHTAAVIGAPVPVFEANPGGSVEANRRIRNAKAKHHLGFAPHFPSFHEGLI